MPTGKGLPVLVRLQPDGLAALDAYRTSADERMTRPQAIRAALIDWLQTKGFIELTPVVSLNESNKRIRSPQRDASKSQKREAQDGSN